ncbi:tetratricopeptide repeat protein [Halobellus sp. Atlit-38R]|uniref:tetratricopeptide repeat protein n=1 Tax=Halobellus sp. Atlit-38R TaxID=2282131 RepID=UPI000EF2508F|nr:tetratricopeptide repeat protein [Halobellus sp. Atlit-38R]RLM88544.1 tetratricopeptide repeat protein [Halobellus sp. Atlit-38R]
MTDTHHKPTDSVRTVLLNALREVTGHATGILEDEQSYEAVQTALETAVQESERSEFDQALAAVNETSGQGEAQIALRRSTDAVYDWLCSHGAQLRLTHLTSVKMNAQQVTLYKFLRTENPAVLNELDVSATVADSLKTGASALASGATDESQPAFSEAIELAETPAEKVSVWVLAAWTRCRAGEYEAALPLVTKALECDPEAWPARVVGTVADHETPSLFWEDKLSVRPYLRVRAEVPEGGDIEAAVRPQRRNDERWVSLSGPRGCLRVPEESFGPNLEVRLRLSGALGTFPTVQAYYLAVGVVDEVNDVPRTVFYQPLQGPRTTDARETLRFRV